MKATPFPEANDVLKAPPGVPEDQCYDLPIHRHAGGVVSCWQPTPQDLLRLQLGEPIYLSVEGKTHPPLCLMVGSPFVSPEASAERAAEIAAGADHCGNCQGYKPCKAGEHEGVCGRFMKMALPHYVCDHHERYIAAAAEVPKPCPCGTPHPPTIVGTGIGDYIVQCHDCNRRSNPINCEGQALAVHRWNQDFLWGDDFED